MKNIRRFAIASVALALGLPAAAQSVETAGPSTTSVRPSPSVAPAYTRHNSGSPKAVLAPFGPYITESGTGAGGGNISQLYNTTSGYNVFGFGMQGGATNNVCADDFVVPAAQNWAVSGFKWLTYQTTAPTTGTITAMYMNLWNTNPTGQNQGSQWKTGGNVYLSKTWTGVYRVTETGKTDANRAISEATCGGAWAGVLGTGTYWLDCKAEGSSTLSGPWAPVETTVNMVPGGNPQFNGLQSTGANPFAAAVDTGLPAFPTPEPVGFLFQVEGTGGGVGTFCTSKPSSLLPVGSCVPTLNVSSGTVSKSGAPAVAVTAGSVPGGAGKPGIIIYTKAGLLGTPGSTPFGFLCINGVTRASAFPASPGGVVGACNGTYAWNLAAIVAAALPAQANVGDNLHLQAWYRDPGFMPPGNANFTNGAGPISVVP